MDIDIRDEAPVAPLAPKPSSSPLALALPGADVVLGKPVRIDSLKKLVALIAREGPQSRYPGQTIVDRGDWMEWAAAPRRQGAHAV